MKDDTDEVDLMIFGKEAEFFFGITANQFANDEKIRKKVEKRLFDLCGQISSSSILNRNILQSPDSNSSILLPSSSSSSSSPSPLLSSSSSSSSSSDYVITVTDKNNKKDKNNNGKQNQIVLNNKFHHPIPLEFNIFTYLTTKISPLTGEKVLKLCVAGTFLGC